MKKIEILLGLSPIIALITIVSVFSYYSNPLTFDNVLTPLAAFTAFAAFYLPIVKDKIKKLPKLSISLKSHAYSKGNFREPPSGKAEIIIKNIGKVPANDIKIDYALYDKQNGEEVQRRGLPFTIGCLNPGRWRLQDLNFNDSVRPGKNYMLEVTGRCKELDTATHESIDIKF